MALIDREGIRLASCSEVIETAAVDVVDQPDFLNQVVGLDTRLDPGELLATCLEIERSLGREREGAPPRGPRTIDLDVLLYEGREIGEDDLVIPHPRLAERPFLIALCHRAGVPKGWLPDPEVP